MRGISFLVLLVVCGTVAALIGCGSSSGGGDDGGGTSCVTIGLSSARALTQGTPHQVRIEVRFLTVTDNFLQGLGIDFDEVITPEADLPLQFGGQFQSRPTYATIDGTIAGGTLADIIVPNGHLSGSHLPAAFRLPPPGTGDAFGFVVAPGTNDQCLNLREDLSFAVDEPNSIPAPTPITPAIDFNAGTGLAVEHLNDAAAKNLIDQIGMTSGQELLEGPTFDLFNTQRLLAMAYTNVGTTTDFLDVVPNVVYSGAPISRVESGTTLDVRPIVNTETMTIRLEIRPLSHGAVSTLGGTTTIQSNPVTIQMPILAPGNQRTTVTVPDGGTLLLGGIKNLSDDGQGGVPLLSRLPYVNRLFKNTSTMATSDTLLIMVTPRIIIQDE